MKWRMLSVAFHRVNSYKKMWMNKWVQVLLIPTYKVRGIMLYPPFIKLRSSVRPSVRLYIRLSVHPSVRPSVCQRIVITLCWSIFNQISSNLLWELILGRSVLGLQMGKFWQISTDLRPLVNVRNWLSLSIICIPLPIFSKLGIKVDIVQ